MNYDEKRKIAWKFNSDMSQLRAGVEIFPIGADDDDDDTKFGINWSAMGTVDLEQLDKFEGDLKKAREVIKTLNEV